METNGNMLARCFALIAFLMPGGTAVFPPSGGKLSVLAIQPGEHNDTSGVRLTVYNLFSTARARLTLARISLADAVQMNGFGFWLCWLMYSVIAPIKSSTL